MTLHELAMALDKQVIHTEDEITHAKNQILKNGKFLQNIEGDKFKLILNDKSIGLFTIDDQFVGFLLFSEIDDSILSLDKIFIVPEFRNQKMAKIFLYWFKMSMKKSIYVGGIVFSDGQNFIKSISKDPRFEDDLVGYDTRTKERFNFDPSQFLNNKTNTGFLFELYGDFFGMYDNRLPGDEVGSKLICLEMFADESY